MTNQEKKRWLLQYRFAIREERRLGLELEQWRARATGCTAHYGADQVGGGDGRKVEHAAERIAGVVEELERQQAECARLRLTISKAIASVPDGRLRELLRLRYVDGLTWEQIAEEMNYGRRQVTRLHGDALERVSIDVLECHI